MRSAFRGDAEVVAHEITGAVGLEPAEERSREQNRAFTLGHAVSEQVLAGLTDEVYTAVTGETARRVDAAERVMKYTAHAAHLTENRAGKLPGAKKPLARTAAV